MNFSIQITQSAAARIKALISEQNLGEQYLRIAVSSGGCYGFLYNFELTKSLEDGDMIIQKEEVQIIVDENSQNFLNNSVLDYIENLGGAYFEVRNPEAKSKCGCGNSFTI